MLYLRIISAAVAAAILVPTLLWGGVQGVTILVAILAGVAMWELARNLPGIKDPLRILLTIAIGLPILFAINYVPLQAFPAIIVFLPLLVILIHLLLYGLIKNTLDSACQMIFVLTYVAIPLAHAILLKHLALGTAWIFFVLVVICLGDAGAYFAGKNFGRHHFSARVSPRKTIEGLLGGVAGNFFGMIIMKCIVSGLPSLYELAQLTLLLALLGPLGDLCASAIKRRLAIKDFGAIMPGHGGILDRADSLIPALPATYYFIVLAGYAGGV